MRVFALFHRGYVVKTRHLTRLALMTTLALTIFMVELQIPSLVPIPGVKLGLSNIVTVFCVFFYGAWSALEVLLCRIILGAVFSGRITAIVYSLAGGLLSWVLMLLLRRFFSEKQIWICSALSGLCHNAGQLMVAVVITGTPSLALYFPILALSGMIAGLFTGLCAQFLVRHLKRI